MGPPTAAAAARAAALAIDSNRARGGHATPAFAPTIICLELPAVVPAGIAAGWDPERCVLAVPRTGLAGWLAGWLDRRGWLGALKKVAGLAGRKAPAEAAPLFIAVTSRGVRLTLCGRRADAAGIKRWRAQRRST